MTHSRIGGSVIGAIMRCPGRFQMAETAPPLPESEYSREGTQAHALADWCLNSGETTADDYIGTKFAEGSVAPFVVSRDMAEAVNVYLAHVWEVFHSRKPAAFYGEQRFRVASLDTGPHEAFGTCDRAVFFPEIGELHIFDYKHGRGVVVEVKGNDQARFYASGAADEFRSHGHRVNRVVVHIVQPRAFHPDGAARSEVVEVFELADWLADARDALDIAVKPGAPCIPGEFQCKFCPGTAVNPATGRTWCEAFQREADAAAATIDGAVIDPKSIPDVIGGVPDSAADIGRRLAQLPMLKSFIKTFEDFAEAEAVAGRMPAGFKWIEGPGRRSWKLGPEETAKTIQHRTNGVDPWKPRELRSPNMIEDALGKATARPVLEGLVERSPGAPKLAPLSNPKPAITLTKAHTDLIGDVEV